MRGAPLLARITPEALLLAPAIPIIFLHVRYQPGVEIRIGGADVDVYLSDVAVLAIVAAALVAGRRLGFEPLRRARLLWLASALFFLWVVVDIALPAGSYGYPWETHAVTAAKFFEYALLAPAVVLLVRRRADLTLLLGVVVAWSAVATVVGLIQFFGANIFVSGATFGRQLSFLGFHDFGALSAAALAVGLAAIALPAFALDRRIAWTGIASGVLGVILAAPVAAVIGLGVAALVLLAVALLRNELALRRFAVVGVILAVTAVGTGLMRADQFARRADDGNVQSYAQRTVLAWIGWQMFLDHPVAGVGWQASEDPQRFMPYVAAARREFPDEPELAFPAPDRPYGIQNLYIQTLADLGLVGLALLLTLLACAVGLASRARDAVTTVGLAWLAVAAGVWAALGIVAGIPLDALTWLAVGLAGQDSPAASGKMPSE